MNRSNCECCFIAALLRQEVSMVGDHIDTNDFGEELLGMVESPSP